jgi:hypothetical protein
LGPDRDHIHLSKLEPSLSIMIKLRARTLPSKSVHQLPLTPPESPRPGSFPPSLPPKYSFLPTHVPSETPSSNSIDSFAYSTDEVTSLRRYGVLAEVGSKLILGLEEVGKVIKEVGAELEKRGKLYSHHTGVVS